MDRRGFLRVALLGGAAPVIVPLETIEKTVSYFFTPKGGWAPLDFVAHGTGFFEGQQIAMYASNDGLRSGFLRVSKIDRMLREVTFQSYEGDYPRRGDLITLG